jgi:hypothetical protein
LWSFDDHDIQSGDRRLPRHRWWNCRIRARIASVRDALNKGRPDRSGTRHATRRHAGGYRGHLPERYAEPGLFLAGAARKQARGRPRLSLSPGKGHGRRFQYHGHVVLARRAVGLRALGRGRRRGLELERRPALFPARRSGRRQTRSGKPRSLPHPPAAPRGMARLRAGD